MMSPRCSIVAISGGVIRNIASARPAALVSAPVFVCRAGQSEGILLRRRRSLGRSPSLRSLAPLGRGSPRSRPCTSPARTPAPPSHTVISKLLPHSVIATPVYRTLIPAEWRAGSRRWQRRAPCLLLSAPGGPSFVDNRPAVTRSMRHTMTSGRNSGSAK
jgi:hypothetical protein